MSSDEEEYEYSDEEDYPAEEDLTMGDDEEEEEEEPYEQDDDDMEEDWGSENPNAAPVLEGYKVSQGVRMLHCNEIVPEMKRRISDVTEVLTIPASASAVLLREHQWSRDYLLETYYNNPDKLLQKYGVWNRCQHQQHKKRRTRSSTKTICEICYDEDVPMWCMPCGHDFCRECWKDFMENALAEGPTCVRKTCPDSKCNEIVTEEDVAAVAPDLLKKFESYQLRSFVERNNLTRWCPGKGCEKVACASNATAKEQEGGRTSCDGCGTLFCLGCGEEPHAPTSCQELVRWKEKCRNESETANWILANTKPCPKCSSRIEKNQGCNHMTCQRCRHEFCWICSGDWNNHGANTGGYYKCNKFDPANADDQSDAAKAKRELDRYLHYYKRYHAHHQAQKFATKQLKETESRMVLLQESSDNAKWTDVEFLKAANEQLVECRRVLKYTYSFAYYLTDESKAMQKERFEHHQEMLERFTECLSELSEKPLNEMDRTGVVNQTRVVDRFMKNVLKYVEDGMEEIP